jgi:hypothetical protein
MTIHENDAENDANFHGNAPENEGLTICAKTEKCYCGMNLHMIPHGGMEFPQCPLHGSAYKEDAEQKARELAK